MSHAAVTYRYDANNRISRILDDGSARTEYLYKGSGRSEVALLNGASTMSTLKVSYDGLNRITSALYRNSGDTATIVGFEHGYDKVGTPEYELRTHQSDEGDAYLYDDLYRLTRVIYDDAAPATVVQAERWLDGNEAEVYACHWDYDAAGN